MSTNLRTNVKHINVLRLVRIHELSQQKAKDSSSLINETKGNIMMLPELDKESKRCFCRCEITLPSETLEHKITAFIDSGADASLMSYDYFCKLFRNKKKVSKLLEPSQIHLVGYTGDEVGIVGEITILVRVNDEMPYQNIRFILTKAENNHPVILGLGAMAVLSLNLVHEMVKGVPTPKIVHAEGGHIESYYLSDYDFAYTSTQVNLKPGSFNYFKVDLPIYSTLVQDDRILISDDFVTNKIPGMRVYPTTCQVIREYGTNRLSGSVQISNESSQPIEGIANLSFEAVNDYDIKPINKKRINIASIRGRPLLVDLAMNDFKNIEIPENTGNLDTEFQDLFSMFKVDTPLEPRQINRIQILPKHCYNVMEYTWPDHKGFVRGDPKSINNGVKGNVSLTDSREPIDNLQTCTFEQLEKFRDPKESIQVGLLDLDEEKMDEILYDEGGYHIPPTEVHKPADLVDLSKFSPEIQPYIKDLFIDKFSNLIAMHSLDLGNLSKTLGYYRIKLKPFAKLPEFKKVYYQTPSEIQQLEAILAFLIKADAISKSDVEGSDDAQLDSFASPSYLIPKSNPNSAARLIVNFKFLNSQLATEPTHLETASSVIHAFRDKYLFTNMDLSCAFQSIRITKESRDLTLFSTPLGTFKHHILPTGLKASPDVLSRMMYKCLHFDTEKDDDGNFKLDENGFPLMKIDIIPGCKTIYDDLILATPLKETKAATLKHHFEILEKVLTRLHNHGAKLGFSKCHFAKTRISFFGFFISANFVSIDPRRIEAIISKPFPSNVKETKIISGHLSFIQGFLGFNVQEQATWLHDLAKTSKFFNPSEEHFIGFKKMKRFLTKSQLYANIICPNADKLLFTDSAIGKQNCFSSVLCQIVKPTDSDEIYPPLGINLEDPNHGIIYDNQFNIVPLDLKKPYQDMKDYKQCAQETHPPSHEYLSEPFYGWAESSAHKSLSITLRLLYEFMDNNLDMYKLIKKMQSNIKSTINGPKYQTLFKHDTDSFKALLKGISKEIFPIDKDMIIFEVLAECLNRPICVISANYDIGAAKRDFGTSESGQTLVFLLYQCKTPPSSRLKEIDNDNDLSLEMTQCDNIDQLFFVVRPGYFPIHKSYPVNQFRGTFEIVTWLNQNIPAKNDASHIFDMEMQGVMVALYKTKKLVGHSPLLLLTDNQALYYVFNQSMVESKSKVKRWRLKLINDYRNLSFGFVKTTDNLADYLTRNYDIEKPNVRRLGLPRFVGNELSEAITQDVYSINEWKDFCDANPQFLKFVEPQEKTQKSINMLNIIKDYNIKRIRNVIMTLDKPFLFKHVNLLTSRFKNALKILHKPLVALQNIFSSSNIITAQKKEFRDFYLKCVGNKEIDIENNGVTYFLVDNILWREKDQNAQIMLPSLYINHAVAMAHILVNHGGYEKVKENLDNWYHPNLRKTIKELTSSCISCQMNNHKNTAVPQGFYNTNADPMTILCCDLMESLPPNDGYKHLLILTDPITGYMFSTPLKEKTSQEFLFYFNTNILPMFNIKKLLCDNGTIFTSIKVLKSLRAIGIEMIYSSAWNSQAHGTAESSVKILKQAIKKAIHLRPEVDWLMAVPILLKRYNLTIKSKTGYTPRELIFGKSTSFQTSHFDYLTDITSKKVFPKLRTAQQQVDKITKEIEEFVKIAKEHIDQERNDRITKINKNRVKGNFKEGEFVMVKNFAPPNKHAFTPYFQLCPYIIDNVYNTTLLLSRASNLHTLALEPDQIASLPANYLHPSEKEKKKKKGKGNKKDEFKLSQNHVRHYKTLSDAFDDLPKEVIDILRKKPDDLNIKDWQYIIKNDNFEILHTNETIEPNSQTNAQNENSMPVVAESSIELSDEMDINDEIFNDVKILDSDSDSDLDNTENNSSAYGNKKSILRNPVASRKSTRDRKPTVQFDASSKSK